MIFANDHLGGVQFDDILIIIFAFAEGVILVDVLHIGISRCSSRIAFRTVSIDVGVAFGIVVILVSLNNLQVLLVIITTAVVVEIVTRRVG